ncbi:hypothetical protein SprV_0401662000 [Sparganum proliferum]
METGTAETASGRAATPGPDTTEEKYHKGLIRKEPLQPDSQTTSWPPHTNTQHWADCEDLAVETIELLLQSKYDETENHIGHAQVLQLLKFCLRTYFTFDGTIYEQVNGTLKGSLDLC